MVRYKEKVFGKRADEWVDIWHVEPVNDEYPHLTVFGDIECACLPSYQEENGSLIITHSSFDGRELEEESETAKDYKRVLDARAIFESKVS